MKKLTEEINKIKSIMGLVVEVSVGNNGELIDFESNIFDEFPDDILKILEDEYGHLYKHNFDWNSKSREFTSSEPGHAYDAVAFNKWMDKNEQEEFVKNLNKIITAVRSDLILLKRRMLAKKKLELFEALIIPVFGKHITGDALSKFEEQVLLDPYATIESLERGFREAKNLIDHEGNIDGSKMEKSTIFPGGDINIPTFERYVQANPEYKKTYDTWYKLFNDEMDLDMKKMNAFRGYSYNYDAFRKLYDFLISYRKGTLNENIDRVLKIMNINERII